MTDVIDEVIAVIEEQNERDDPGSVLAPPESDDPSDFAWVNVISAALAHVVSERMRANRSAKARTSVGHTNDGDGTAVSPPPPPIFQLLNLRQEVPLGATIDFQPRPPPEAPQIMPPKRKGESSADYRVRVLGHQVSREFFESEVRKAVCEIAARANLVLPREVSFRWDDEKR